MDTSCGQASGTVVIYSDYSMNMFRQHPEIRKIAGTGSRKSNLYFLIKKTGRDFSPCPFLLAESASIRS
jgi:hypothetical protein